MILAAAWLRRLSAVDRWLQNAAATVDTAHCVSALLQVTGMVSGVPYVFNIVNFETPGSQFKQGMQPLLFSVKEVETCGRGWWRAGENVTYFTNNYKYHDVS